MQLSTIARNQGDYKSNERTGCQNDGKRATTHCSTMIRHSTSHAILHTLDTCNSCCRWVVIPIVLLVMLFPPSGIPSPTFPDSPGSTQHLGPRYKFKMCECFDPVHLLWRIYPQGIIGVVPWVCTAMCQDICSIYVIFRS